MITDTMLYYDKQPKDPLSPLLSSTHSPYNPLPLPMISRNVLHPSGKPLGLSRAQSLLPPWEAAACSPEGGLRCSATPSATGSHSARTRASGRRSRISIDSVLAEQVSIELRERLGWGSKSGSKTLREQNLRGLSDVCHKALPARGCGYTSHLTCRHLADDNIGMHVKSQKPACS